MMKNEIWKDIPEYKGLYQVSNMGMVKGLERKIKIFRTNHGKPESYIKTWFEKELK